MEVTFHPATSITPHVDEGVTWAGQSERTAAGPGARTGDGQPVCTIATGCTDPPDSETSTSTFLHSHLGVTTETVVTDDQTTTTAYTRDPAGRLLSADGPSEPTWFFTDGLGSVVGIGDDLGQLAATYRYDPFGVTAEADGPLAATNPWRYTGAYLDATGLHKLGERYYDPSGVFGCTVSLAGVTGVFTFTELLMVVGETVLGFKSGESLASKIFQCM